MKVYSTVCPRNCYSACSLKVHVEDGKIMLIEPHPRNLATPEGPCLKGLSYVERVHSPDRLLYPILRKQGTDKFHRISWDEVFTLLADKLTYFKEKYGPMSILFYKASGMAGLINSIPFEFWEMFGGCTTTYGDLCWPAGLEGTRLTLGENKHNVPWDLENAKLIIMWGKNAVESNVQEMIHVENAIERGAKLVVIDPRRTPTADKADLLLQPKPGTDVGLALGVARILIEENRIDHDFIQKHVLGFSGFEESLKKYTPNLVQQITGIPVELIHKLARYIGELKPMTIIPGYGYQRYTNGGQTTRCILALQVITGNIGKPGACWHYANLQSYVFDKILEPLSLYPTKNKNEIFRRSISTTRLGIDMLNTRDPVLKMIWVERGNPVTQNPDTNSVLKAFRKLDFRVVVEQFLTDTTREADLILPAKSMFEQSDIIGSYWNPYVQLKQKVIDPPGEVKPESEIYYLLAKELGLNNEEITTKIPGPGNDSIENWLSEKLELFPDLTMDKLKEGPVLAPNLEEIAFSNLKFTTPSGKIELFSEQAQEMWEVDPLPAYSEPVEAGHSAKEMQDFPFILLTPTTKNRIHSQFGNLKIINQFDPVKGFSDYNLGPKINFVSRSKKERKPEMARKRYIPEQAVKHLKDIPGLLTPVNLGSEWPLTIFTFLVPLIIGMFAGVTVSDIHLPNELFLSFGFITLLMSLFHLGKKGLFYRAVFNIKGSWLSREILFFILFLGVSTFTVIAGLDALWLILTILVLGFLTTFSIDMVYHLKSRSDGEFWHSSQTLLTAMLFTAIYLKAFYPLVFILSLKLLLYLFRKTRRAKANRDPRWLISLLRILTGMATPLFFYILDPQIYWSFILISTCVGEMIDRIEFYLELEFINPENEFYSDLLECLKTGVNN